jgi:hypothetical protein
MLHPRSNPVRWHTGYGGNYGSDPEWGRNPAFRVPGSLYEAAARDAGEGFSAGFHQLSGHRLYAGVDGVAKTDRLVSFESRLDDWQVEELGRIARDFGPPALYSGAWLPPASPLAGAGGMEPFESCRLPDFDRYSAEVAAEWGRLWELGCVLFLDAASWKEPDSGMPAAFERVQRRAVACGREAPWGEAWPLTAVARVPSALARRGRWWCYSVFYERWVGKTRWTCPRGTLRCAMQSFWENGVVTHRPTPALCAELAARGVELDVWEGEGAEVEGAVRGSWGSAETQ